MRRREKGQRWKKGENRGLVDYSFENKGLIFLLGLSAVA
jgi:hypothetical protein